VGLRLERRRKFNLTTHCKWVECCERPMKLSITHKFDIGVTLHAIVNKIFYAPLNTKS
jgi:hypothetical protein